MTHRCVLPFTLEWWKCGCAAVILLSVDLRARISIVQNNCTELSAFHRNKDKYT